MALFWVTAVTAVLIVVYQITQIQWHGYEGLLLAEIIMLGIALHTVYQIPFYGIYDSDSYETMVQARRVLEFGGIMEARPGLESSLYWPLSKIYGAQLHYLTGITTFNIAKWSSLIMSSVFILLLYVLVKKVSNSEKAALLAILLMVTLQYFTFLGSKFHYENLALIMMMSGLFLLTRTEGTRGVGFIALSMLCLFGVIFTHHLTPLIMLVFLFICLATNRILGSIGSINLSTKTTLDVTAGFALLAFVGVFAYWLYVYNESFVALTRLGQTLLTGELGAGTGAEAMGILEPETIPTLRGQITFYGYYFFMAIFSVILFYKVFFQPKDKYPEFYSFAIMLFACGVLVFLAMYLLPVYSGSIPPRRLFTWGWIFGFAPLAFGILENRPRWSRKVGMILLAGFMLFNVYTIPQNTWDIQEPGRLSGNIVLREDYAVAEAFALSGEGAAYHKTRLAIYHVQDYFCRDLRAVSDIEQLETLDWIVVKKGELETYAEGLSTQPASEAVVNELSELSEGGSYQGRNKIYESNDLMVFK